MSGQHNGPYDSQTAPGTMGSLVNSVDSYLNEFTNGQGTNNIIPQQRGQSLQHHNTSYRYYDYHNDNYAARRQSGYDQSVDSAKYYAGAPGTASYYDNQQMYHHDYQVRRTPPGSPSARHAYHYHQQQQQQHYPGNYSHQPATTSAAAYPPPPVGYSRTSSEEYAQSYRPVYGSDTSPSASTPSSYYSSSTSNNATPTHRRTPSSLKMTITTIERPKYAIPDAINTSNLGGKDGEVPFVPVSPDSSDEEEYFAFHRNNNNNAAPVIEQPPPATPVHTLEPRADVQELEVKETQVSMPQQQQNWEEQQQQQQPVPEQDPNQDKEQQQRNSTMSRLSIADTDYSYLSALSDAVKKKIKALENVRELFCANEYPESFTGQEVVKALRETLAHKNIPDGYCILIANALMHAKPALFQPVHYNHKSLITGVVYNSPDEIYTFDEDASDDDVPNGVFTSLTRCYTYGCEPGAGGCYAPKCPNKAEVFEEEIMTHANLSRQSSVQSLAPVDSDKSYPHIPWSARVPRELLESVSKRERDRQEAINEMIYSEEVYRDDLDTLHEVIVAPLAESNIIEPSRRKQFIKQVFNNYEELREVSHALFKDLLDLQRRFDQKCVPMIGDILVQHVAYFEKPFVSYTPRVALAEYLVLVEKRNNPEFARFITEVEKNSRMKRLAFRHFLVNPVTRMQRYPLLLDSIIKKTDQDHPDYAYLVRCKEVITAIAARSDAQTGVFEQHVNILKIDDMLTSKQGENHELHLKDAHRKLYHRGDLKRRSQGIEMTEKSDIHAFVFDHVFLMTKMRKTSSGDEYRIWKRPIPLQMLFVQRGSDYSSQSSSSRSPLPSASSSYMLQGPSSAGSSGGVSLTLQHLGQRDGTYHFFCASPEEKQAWVKAIEDAKAALKKRQGENDVYELRVLDDSSFRYFAAAGVGNQAKINCSVPFMSAQGDYKLVIGTDIGVYVKTVGQNDAYRVILCDNVTQVAIMERHHILLVLADKTLRAYPLDSVKSNTPTTGPSQELAQSVTFFQVGYCNNRHLVVYRRKKGTSSFFVALEPACDLRDPRNVKLLTQRTGFLGRGSSHSWFKKYKDFYVGAEASNIHFLKSKVSVVVDSRGFEIIDPENLGVGGRNIPDSADPQFNFVQRHTEPLKPLAMYRIQDKFLLCYNRFAFYVNNRNGSLVNRGAGRSPLLCAWEGNPDHVVYQHPYIIAIDSQFIEVRKVDTGELAQIIPGENIRLTYYNGGETPVIHGCMTHPQRPDMQVLFQLWLSKPQRTTNSGSSSSGYPRR